MSAIIDRLNQAEEQQRKMKWQPIETAPKDGSCVLVFPGIWNNTPCSIARWDDNKYANNPRPFWRRLDAMGSVSRSLYNPPTHWMPLPEPPTEET